MPFQSDIRRFQADGIVGDIIFDGPFRGMPGNLQSTDPLNNIIGRAFFYNSPGTATQDVSAVTADIGGGADGSPVFAGFLVNSKNYALQGSDTGSLTPSLRLLNETSVELLTMGIFFGNLTLSVTGNSGQGQIGSRVFVNTETGELGSSTLDDTDLAALLSDAFFATYALINSAVVSRQSVDATGLAVITVTQ